MNIFIIILGALSIIPYRALLESIAWTGIGGAAIGLISLALYGAIIGSFFALKRRFPETKLLLVYSIFSVVLLFLIGATMINIRETDYFAPMLIAPVISAFLVLISISSETFKSVIFLKYISLFLIIFSIYGATFLTNIILQIKGEAYAKSLTIQIVKEDYLYSENEKPVGFRLTFSVLPETNEFSTYDFPVFLDEVPNGRELTVVNAIINPLPDGQKLKNGILYKIELYAVPDYVEGIVGIGSNDVKNVMVDNGKVANLKRVSCISEKYRDTYGNKNYSGKISASFRSWVTSTTKDYQDAVMYNGLKAEGVLVCDEVLLQQHGTSSIKPWLQQQGIDRPN